MGAIADAMVVYAQPLLNETDGSEEELNKAFAISQFCWNLALLPKESQEKTVSEMRQTLKMDDYDFDAFRRSILVPMIRRHEELFPQMHQHVPTVPSQSDFSRRVQPRSSAPTDNYAGTDRYAPCPCNSGRKYKFCCGVRGVESRPRTFAAR